ncbi:hypothetical protein [Actinomadura gamaensis]|uniref:Uncharacterized protein n=1 Tax=Actinomadura gamaensis TaxID=1763541 RepID=A0ABV9TTN6_9ACTN
MARWIENPEQGPDDIVVKAPCCDRLFHLQYEYAGANLYLLLCIFCQIAYEVQVIDDGDGGFSAVLTVEDIPFITTRRRVADGSRDRSTTQC